MEVNNRPGDWRHWKSGWQYKTDAPNDPEWQQDRLNLFRENGNGWWWFQNKGQSVNEVFHI